MKYTYESTEAETLAYIAFTERMLAPLVSLLSQKLSDLVMPPGTESVPAPTGTEVAPAPTPVASPTPKPTSAPPAAEYLDFDAAEPEMSSFGVPIPQSVVQPKVELAHIEPERRAEAWAAFKAFCLAWVQGFEQPEATQPNRSKLMEGLGSGANTIPVLVMTYEIESLQRLVEKALLEGGVRPDGVPEAEWLDWVDRVAATMVQISHCGYYELAGTYDYTQRWRRKK